MYEETPCRPITQADIDNVMKQVEEEANKPTPMTHCPSCGTELPCILTDYRTGQCEQCFHDRKPWCQSSPVRDAYFKLTDGL
jgi:hypothetical protein